MSIDVKPQLQFGSLQGPICQQSWAPLIQAACPTLPAAIGRTRPPSLPRIKRTKVSGRRVAASHSPPAHSLSLRHSLSPSPPLSLSLSLTPSFTLSPTHQVHKGFREVAARRPWRTLSSVPHMNSVRVYPGPVSGLVWLICSEFGLVWLI